MKILFKAGRNVIGCLLLVAITLILWPNLPVAAEDSDFKCWAVFVGLSEYQHLDSSEGCAEGATKFYETISPIWGKEQCRLLTDKEATKNKMKEAIDWLAENAGDKDTVLLYYSGHGAYGGYISTYNSSFEYNWIATLELKLWLQDIEAEKIVVILDSCFSGNFIPLLNSEGCVIMVSSRNTEVSYTWPERGGGIFTICLQTGINDFINSQVFDDTRLSAEELFELAEAGTIEQTTYADTVQHPAMSDGYDGELSLLIHYFLRTDPSMSTDKDIYIVDGEAYSGDDLLTWAPGSLHSMEILPEIVTGTGTKYLFKSWGNGDTSPVRVISGEDEYTASYVIQYRLTIISDYGIPEGDGWYDKDGTAIISIESVDGIGAKHYFTSWSGDYSGEETTAEINMDSPKTITANWHSEYLLNIKSAFGEPMGAGWYDEGMRALVSIESVEGANARHYFTGWSGDYSGYKNDFEIVMDSPKTVTANWRSEYFLDIESARGEPTGGGWYDEGALAGVSVASIEGANARHYFTGWSGDYSGNENDFEILIDSPKSVTANWHSEYLLDIETAYGEATGSGWHDEGTVVTISVPNSNGLIVRQVFDGWSGDFTGTSPTDEVDITMPMTITAEWRTDYLQLYILIGGLLIVTIIAYFILRTRRSNR